MHTQADNYALHCFGSATASRRGKACRQERSRCLRRLASAYMPRRRSEQVLHLGGVAAFRTLERVTDVCHSWARRPISAVVHESTQ
eukprot:361204-Chlamydomonas_euryale.AAC.3